MVEMGKITAWEVGIIGEAKKQGRSPLVFYILFYSFKILLQQL